MKQLLTPLVLPNQHCNKNIACEREIKTNATTCFTLSQQHFALSYHFDIAYGAAVIGQLVLEEQDVLVEHDLLLLLQLLHVDAVVGGLRRQLLVAQQRAPVVGGERPVERTRHRVDVWHVTAASTEHEE